MEDNLGVAERLEAGQEVDVSEIIARLNELEAAFEERGFLYIAINDWLIPALDGDQEARELMFLRAVGAQLDEDRGGKVFLAEDSDAVLVCRLSGRYVPDGSLYAVEAPASEARM